MGPAPASPRRLARIAGLFYLLVLVFGVFAHLVVRGELYVPGDAAATAANLAEQPTLFRLGYVADLLMATFLLLTAMALYRLLRHVHADAARAMVVFTAVGTAITFAVLSSSFAALLAATEEPYPAALGDSGSAATALLLLDTHHYGYLSAQVFFGLWLLPLGYLVYRSGMFPRWLGVLLIAGGVGFLVDTVLLFLVPGVRDTLDPVVGTLTSVAELVMIAWLLIRGARPARLSAPAGSPSAPAPTAAT
ncbi:DUF4386 domain-containing protein [Geodermatophilus marinus]|nr:DUF4386 domain-containing protein [Geodermatophilus sp. LHW52908]